MKKMLLKGLTLCLMLLCSGQAHAQLDNLLNKVTSAVTGKTTVSESTLVNTWTYSGAAVEFESKDVLTNLGGTAASTTIENSLNKNLQKIGITAGKVKFTFKADKTFTTTMNGKTRQGTYTLNGKTLNLKFTTLGKGINCIAQMSGSNLELLFSADKIKTILVAVGAKSGSASLSTVSSLLGKTDGMDLGLKFKK